jgi:hypothetical protein
MMSLMPPLFAATLPHIAASALLLTRHATRAPPPLRQMPMLLVCYDTRDCYAAATFSPCFRRHAAAIFSAHFRC